jgi:hypothetical protein
MKFLAITIASVLLVVSGAHAQNSRVPEPEARTPGQPTVGPPQTTDSKTTTGQAPTRVPGTGSPYGAKGGPTGAPNPDRVVPGTPGGASKRPGN